MSGMRKGTFDFKKTVKILVVQRPRVQPPNASSNTTNRRKGQTVVGEKVMQFINVCVCVWFFVILTLPLRVSLL